MTLPDFSDYTVKWVTLPWEVQQAYALRRRVFCDEQGLFTDNDRDTTDSGAQLLVALGNHGGWHQQVVGTVRIHSDADGVWYGSRLAVDADFRSQGQLGAQLIRLAVSSAHGLGCRRFLARVQRRNEPLFRRLHWQSLERFNYCGKPHVLMEADLQTYPPCHSPNSGFVIKARRQHQRIGIWPGLLESSKATTPLMKPVRG